jgi:hypothetical protein
MHTREFTGYILTINDSERIEVDDKIIPGKIPAYEYAEMLKKLISGLFFTGQFIMTVGVSFLLLPGLQSVLNPVIVYRFVNPFFCKN